MIALHGSVERTTLRCKKLEQKRWLLLTVAMLLETISGFGEPTTTSMVLFTTVITR